MPHPVATLVTADVFVDGSGASALVRVGGALFACSASDLAKPSEIRLCQNRAQTNRASKAAWRAAERLFRTEVTDHFTPAYLARNAALYAAEEPTP